MKNKIQGNEIRYFLFGAFVYFMAIALVLDTPANLVNGIIEIIQTRVVFTVDHFAVAGHGATYFNAALLLLICLALVEINKVRYVGGTIGAIMITFTYGFWGMNPMNIAPIVFGTFLYAKFKGESFSKYVGTSLFACCLAPFVTDVFFIAPFNSIANLVVAFLMGSLIGFIFPMVASHTPNVHKGYSLFNAGLAGGLIAFVFFCVQRAFKYEAFSQTVWQEGQHPVVVGTTIAFFIATFLFGLWVEGGNIKKWFAVMKHSGKGCDYVSLEGNGAALMNMGATAMVTTIYILLVGGDFAGPALGCIFTVYGFAANGAHPRNYIPVLLGLYLATLFNQYDAASAGLLVSASFVCGLGPIAGTFGPIAGLIAAMLHCCVVTCTGSICGGYNLYNNGFAMGLLLCVLVPILETVFARIKELKGNN